MFLTHIPKKKQRKKIYFDANIWVAWLRGNQDAHFKKASKLIKNLEKNNQVVVVTQLVMLETIHVLRKKLLKNMDKTQTNKDMENYIKNVVDYFLSHLENMEAADLVKRTKPRRCISRHHERVLVKTLGYFGHVIVMYKCAKCNNVVKTQECECGSNSFKEKLYYKGLGHADLEHAYLALDNKVEDFLHV